MRKMFSEKQIKRMVAESPNEVVEALRGQDINVEGITSKGIANTGGLANIGNVAITGNLSLQGEGKGVITGNEIIELMEGYSFDFVSGPAEGFTITPVYAGAVKTGNKLTLVWYMKLSTTQASSVTYAGDFIIPKAVGNKIIPNPDLSNAVAVGKVGLYTGIATSVSADYSLAKYSQTDNDRIALILRNISEISLNTDYTFRVEATFLLSDSLAEE